MRDLSIIFFKLIKKMRISSCSCSCSSYDNDDKYGRTHNNEHNNENDDDNHLTLLLQTM